MLDTHVFVWMLDSETKVAPEALLYIDDNAEERIFVSIVSIWELVIKQRIGKFSAAIDDVLGQLAPVSRIELLDLMPEHVSALRALPTHRHHRDPFDHMIIAQAIAEGMTLLTRDGRAELYPVRIMRA